VSAAICLAGAALTFFLAENLVSAFHLYRFGVEEAAAISAAALAGIAAAIYTKDFGSTDLVVTAVAASLIYFRFGYLGAAMGAMLSLSAIPFRMDLPNDLARLISAGVLALIWFIAGQLRKPYGDDFPGDEYATIEAMAWLGVYGFLNLHLFTFAISLPARTATESLFYWFTYLATWALPLIGLYLGIRDKHRWMMDVNLCLVLLTLITNKPYLHALQKPWDPVLFGLLLVGVALVVRRWIANGTDGFRKGFTTVRLLNSEARSMAIATTAAVAFHPGGVPNQPSSPDTFQPGGGHSGGAGASGTF
jgi:hypothetical protein